MPPVEELERELTGAHERSSLNGKAPVTRKNLKVYKYFFSESNGTPLQCWNAGQSLSSVGGSQPEELS